MSKKNLGESIPIKMTESYNRVSSVADDSDDDSIKKAIISKDPGILKNRVTFI